MKVLQVNTTFNYGSTGKIAEDIGNLLIRRGYDSAIAAAWGTTTNSHLFIVGNKFDRLIHGFYSLFFDAHGNASIESTKKLIDEIKIWQPDIIHLHNIHGYYINMGILFEFINSISVPVVWTLHDCWSFTGHCSYFDRVGCSKWQTECNSCPNQKGYPRNIGFDRSKYNFYKKKSFFTNCKNLTIVTPSDWLAKNVQLSFLSGYPVRRIYNGIDLEKFKPFDNFDEVRSKYKIIKPKVYLGVANVWDLRKGLNDFIALNSLLYDDEQIVLVGLSKGQLKNLPDSIIGIERTESINDLVGLYSLAAVFVNPTSVDNFPTTTLEALACGTPVITYDTGGCAEALSTDTGLVIEKGDIGLLRKSLTEISSNPSKYTSANCRNRALQCFGKLDRYNEYLSLYSEILNN